jgi:hypothetical protein
MHSAWLARARWRRSGAWLWPTFVIAAILDGLIVHTWPLVGDGQTFYGGMLDGLILSLLGIILFTRPVAALIRRRRPDLPDVVARDYAGTFSVCLVSALLAALGQLHHTDAAVRARATARAEAYIQRHAPLQFSVNARHPDLYALEPGAVYRICVPSRVGPDDYCVIVRAHVSGAGGVVPAGSEPNQVMSQGTN